MLLFLSNFHLFLIGKSGYLLLLVILLVAFTLFIYRRTNPVVSRFVHSFLTGARALALMILLISLFQTTVQWQQEEQIPPLLAVAIDQSASMNVRDASGDRPAQIHRLITEDLSQYLNNQIQLKYFGFSESSVELQNSELDSLGFSGDVSDISGSLSEITGQLREENLAGIVLLTDGNYTRGGNPVRYAGELNTPLFVVGIGTPESQPDLAISEVTANAFAFVNESVPIRVTVRNKGFQNTHTRVRLRDEAGEWDALALNLMTSPMDTNVTFQYIARQAGRVKLIAEIDAKQGEWSPANNKKTIYLDVLKSRVKIFIITGRFTADISFLRNHLSTSERFDIRSLV
ncbi:hypothetical protein JXO59_13240, partial [candidate division KSB1 bacterium]|nr:hypothetical protein [candidate division KSB1 bacterium]